MGSGPRRTAITPLPGPLPCLRHAPVGPPTLAARCWLAGGAVVALCSLTRANGAQKVGNDGERANAHAAKGGSGGDVPVKLLLQAAYGVAVALQARWQGSRDEAGCKSSAHGAQGRQAEAGVGHVRAGSCQEGALTARKYCWSRSCLATSLADWPDTSIQVMENTAQTGGGRSVWVGQSRVENNRARRAAGHLSDPKTGGGSTGKHSRHNGGSITHCPA